MKEKNIYNIMKRRRRKNGVGFMNSSKKLEKVIDNKPDNGIEIHKRVGFFVLFGANKDLGSFTIILLSDT